MRRLRAAPIAALAGSLACRAPESRARQVDTMMDTMTVATSTFRALPAASVRGRMTLEEALARRRSVRAFAPDTLDERTIAQLLWAAQGVTSPEGFRTAPSAGALYPLEVYVARRGGLTHYQPRGHRQELLLAHDPRPELARAAYRQSVVVEAPAVFVITAVVARTAAKYDGRAERFVHLEAGHAAQNLLLQAVALGLGAVPIGAFDDQRVRDALHLPPGEEPLYLIPVGHPGA
ncbi:MAG TPA: SagB/ThcOx family dehydrogenase [Gemmatimonadaceae bacterium]|nr:SagB/ThcOx family dehydrogenase [Gemmatimonadaceae bacterium]